MGHKTISRSILLQMLLGVADYYLRPSYRKSYKKTWGGPFNGQAFRQRIFIELIHKLNFSAIFETGSFRGGTTEYLYESARLPVYTAELNPRYYGYAKTRMRRHKSIVLYRGDSRTFLRHFTRNPLLAGQRLFFYLDAHWGDDLPLREEVQIIFENCPEAVIMIDDFKVPGDEGYGYDSYGQGKELSMDYLNHPNDKLKAAAFFPSMRAESETGAKRGCVVLTRAPELVELLKGVETLTPYVQAA